jgi:hypothetical protein
MRTLLLLSMLVAMCACATSERHATPVEPPPPAPESTARAPGIPELIDELQQVAQAMPGMSTVRGGAGFAPVPDATVRFGGFTLGSTESQHVSDAFTRLVARGPEAIPYLLEALSDDRLTQYVVGGGAFLNLTVGQELWLQDDVPREKAALDAFPQLREDHASWGELDVFERDGHFSRSYQLRVGDVCFVALGQISNRMFSATRYQPTRNLVINTPVYTPILAEATRKSWEGVKDYRAALLESLLIDLADDGRWRYRMCGAATRLLYYFGDEGARAVLQRLSGMQETSDDRLADFIKFIRFSDEPSIAAALLGMLDQPLDDEAAKQLLPVLLRESPRRYAELLRTMREDEDRSDPFAFGENGHRFKREAALTAARESRHEAVREEMSLALDEARTPEEVWACIPAGAALRPEATVETVRKQINQSRFYEHPRGPVYGLMSALAEYLPDHAAELVREQAAREEPFRQTAAAMVIGDLEISGWRETLRPLLESKAISGYGMFRAKTTADEGDRQHVTHHQLPYRVCDIAAYAASLRDPALSFEIKGNYDDLDAQIETIRKALGNE